MITINFEEAIYKASQLLPYNKKDIRMANFHAILDPLVSHGKLDGNDLCALAKVDKLCKTKVDWNVIKQEYANSTKLNQRQDVQYIC